MTTGRAADPDHRGHGRSAPTPQTNTATISHADQFDPDTGNNTASATETPQQADLALTKTVSNPTPNVGDTITFTVTLTNTGPDAATNVAVHDLLPAGPDVRLGHAQPGDLRPAPPASGPSARSTTGTPADPDHPGHGGQPRRADQHGDHQPRRPVRPRHRQQQASATETPQQADLALTKTVSNPTPNVGDTITFTVTLTNNGPDAATGVHGQRPAAGRA